MKCITSSPTTSSHSLDVLSILQGLLSQLHYSRSYNEGPLPSPSPPPPPLLASEIEKKPGMDRVTDFSMASFLRSI